VFFGDLNKIVVRLREVGKESFYDGAERAGDGSSSVYRSSSALQL
jgi:hypothetical protein